MNEEIIINYKSELKKCVLNLINEDTIHLGFEKKSIFIDHSHKFWFDILLQSVNNVSTFVSERNSSGFNVTVDPRHLHNALSMCIDDSPIVVLLNRGTLKIVQDNASYTLPVKDFKRGNYFRNAMCEKIKGKEKDIINLMEIQMSEINNAFKKIHAAEAHGIFPPRYRFKLNEESPSIRKGDNLYHNLAISLRNYNFSGVPSNIEFSDEIKKICKIFYPEFIVKTKSYKEEVILFSQEMMNTKIYFIVGGMSD